MTQTIWTLAKHTFTEWQKDRALQLGAALSYYTIFSISPLLLIVIGIAGLVFGNDAARTQIMQQIELLLGSQGAGAINEMLQHTYRHQTGMIATIIGFVTLLLGASGVLGQLKESMNIIWNVEPAEGGGITHLIQERLASFGMVLAVGFLLLVSLVMSAILTAFVSYWGVPALVEVANFIISVAVITILFAMIFKFLPDARVEWKDVWIGALVTAFLFTIGKTLTALYLSKTAIASSFGAAGSLVIVLVWVYYNAQVLFLGAEFTQVYSLLRQKPPQNEIPVENKFKKDEEWKSAGTIDSVAHFAGYQTARVESKMNDVRKKWSLTKWIYRAVKVIGVKTSAKLGWKAYKIKKKRVSNHS